MIHQFKKAKIENLEEIWPIFKDAIARRKSDGSNQWQDGYPNLNVLSQDIKNEKGFILLENNEIVGYCAIFINDEVDYEEIDGKWLSKGDFVVFHRLAIAEDHLSKGLSTQIFEHIETYARQNNIKSIKADTNFDNPAMLHLFKKMGYHYCGEIKIKGSPREAFEKLIEV